MTEWGTVAGRQLSADLMGRADSQGKLPMPLTPRKRGRKDALTEITTAGMPVRFNEGSGRTAVRIPLTRKPAATIIHRC